MPKRKSFRRCIICKRKATGALVYQSFDHRLGRHTYHRSGALLCQEDLEIATHANLARILRLEDLVLTAARVGG